MNERAARLAGLVTVDQELEREFETRLVESARLVFRVAYSVLRQREDAEEVAQEAFAKAYRSFHQLRHRERFRAWIVRMAWRMALDRQRANRRRALREDRAGRDEELRGQTNAAARTPTHVADLQVRLEAEERAEHLWRAIDALSDKLRIVIVLAAIEGYDVKEIAALLDVPEGTVKSRLFDARQQLKKALSWMNDDRVR